MQLKQCVTVLAAIWHTIYFSASLFSRQELNMALFTSFEENLMVSDLCFINERKLYFREYVSLMSIRYNSLNIAS